ncbi:hypothetical protein ACQEVF_42235 [Nonomuraea polychroma]|uniref:hypothetical protein n=1 Tax=Nonomuraea polychroma TaxID=46176 RepID=UPI003D907D97
MPRPPRRPRRRKRTGRNYGDTQTFYLLALEFGLAAPERAAAHLVPPPLHERS